MLTVDNIYKSFGDKTVLKGVSLAVQNGQITSLIGSNGAGKSTLIGVICGYYNHNSGIITKNSVSVMPDADNLFSNMTGRYFLNFIGKLKGIKKPEDEWLPLCQLLQVEKSLDKKMKEYSFGMKKKISFIQACLGEYDVYILDEPTSGVDVHSSIIMMDIIQELKNKNSGVLLTSHNISELEEVSDHVYFLNNGIIEKKGTVKQIIKSSSSLYNKTETPFFIETKEIDLVVKYLNSLQISTFNIEENGLFVYLDDEKQIQTIILDLMNQHVMISGFWKKDISLKEALF
jgi:ABC-2 type transport system ATP-binding protein